MKLNTTLALSLLVSFTGGTVFQTLAMDVSDLQAPQGTESSWIWIKNDSKWNIEVIYTQTKEAGGARITRRLGPGESTPLDTAGNIKLIQYHTYGSTYSLAAKNYTLDFEKDIQAGSDVMFIIRAKSVAGTGAESSQWNPAEWQLGSWEVVAQQIERPKDTGVEEEGERAASAIDPWKPLSSEGRRFYLEAKQIELKAYRIMMGLGQDYTLVDLDNAYRALLKVNNPEEAGEAERAQRRATTELIQRAYQALKDQI